MATKKKAKTPKTPKARTTPAQERAFIITSLEKILKEHHESAKFSASKKGGFDFEYAAYQESAAGTVENIIQDIYDLPE